MIRKYSILLMSLVALIFGCGECFAGNGRASKGDGGMTVTSVKIGEYVGGRIDDCFRHRVMEQDVDEIVEPFRHRVESWKWNSEFWGNGRSGQSGRIVTPGIPGFTPKSGSLSVT